MRIPRYGEDSLDQVLPSLAGSLGIPGWDDRLGIADAYEEAGVAPVRVVLLLVDGLGRHALDAHLDRAPHLAGGTTISAAVPTTTPTGLGSLGTGLPPRGHGLVGAAFRLPETGRLLHPLGWADDPHPTAVQPEPTVFERLTAAGVSVRTVAPRAYQHSGLTRAALRGGSYVGADSVGERVAAVADDSAVLTYCYWPDLDRVGHVHGVDSPQWRAELEHVDGIVAALARHCDQDTAIVVTADHGMVDCDPPDRLDLDALPALHAGVAVLAGEPRLRHVYVRPGAAEEVRAAWAETLGDRAWVLERGAALAAGLFGPTDDGVDERIGDVVALARGTTCLASNRVDSVVSGLRGQHGSVTHDEIDIPLIVVPGGS